MLLLIKIYGDSIEGFAVSERAVICETQIPMSFTFKIYKANHTLVKYLSVHILC